MHFTSTELVCGQCFLLWVQSIVSSSGCLLSSFRSEHQPGKSSIKPLSIPLTALAHITSAPEEAAQRTPHRKPPLALSLPSVLTNTAVGKMHLEAEKLCWVQLQWGWRSGDDVSSQSCWMRMRRLANGITQSVWMCFCSTPVLGASAQHGGGLRFSPLHWLLLHLLLLSSLFVHTHPWTSNRWWIQSLTVFSSVSSSDHCRGTDSHMNSCENLLQVS